MKELSFRLIVFIFIAAVFASCSSLGSKKSKRLSQKKSDSLTSSAYSVGKAEGEKSRFDDTTRIFLNFSSSLIDEESLDSQFIQAVSEFNNANYKVACSKFSKFMNTLAPGDSLHLEASFYRCECLLLDEEIQTAEIILEEIYKQKNIHSSLRERVLVRLGQVYCYNGKQKNALKLFDEFKALYPKSIYLKIANCESVK